MSDGTRFVLAVAAALLCLPTAVAAQLPGDIPDQESVIVDYTVLDQLGPEPTLPDLLLGRHPALAPVIIGGPPQPVETITLTPPDLTKGGRAKARRARSAPPPSRPKVAKPAAPDPTKAVRAAEPASPKVAAAKTARVPAVEDPAPKSLARPKPAPAPDPVPAVPSITALDAVPSPIVSARPAKPESIPAMAERGLVTPPPAAARVEQPVRVAAVAPGAPAPVAAPSGAPSGDGDAMTVLFSADSADLPAAVGPGLDRLAKRLQSDGDLQLQLLAYAGGDEGAASRARRLSLSRALVVRSYLMNKGIRSTRIEVRALGNRFESGPADRVDLKVERR